MSSPSELSPLSPLFRNFRHFWVVFTFFTFPSPPHLAFASTLTKDAHHDLQHPPSSLEASISCFHVVTFVTLTERSPLFRNFHHFDGTFATCTELSPLGFNFQGFSFRSKGGAFRSNAFAFRSNFFFSISELSPLLRNFRHFYGTLGTFWLCSPFSRSLRLFKSLLLPH